MTESTLIHRILSTDPQDPDGLNRLLGALDYARDELATGSRSRERFDGAIALLRVLARAPASVTPDDLKSVAKLIAGAPSDAQPGHPEGEAEEPRSATSPSGVGLHDLRLASDMALGDVLLRKQFLGMGQLERALRIQFRTGQRLGEVLVEREEITAAQLEEALRLQLMAREELASESADPEAREFGYQRSMLDCLLGELLLRHGTITQEQLDEGLLAQRATGMRIGEALVDVGAVTWGQIEHALQMQELRRGA